MVNRFGQDVVKAVDDLPAIGFQNLHRSEAGMDVAGQHIFGEVENRFWAIGENDLALGSLFFH
ncbi:hypothetical protein D3C77_625720 [compost metagenome]